jgi:hypothetical protein
MSVDSVVSFSNQHAMRNVSAVMQVSAAKRNLDQQELQGQAALKLLEAAAVPVDPSVGQNIDIYA